MKIVAPRHLGVELPAIPGFQSEPYDFSALMQHPAMQSLHALAEHLFGMSFQISTTAGGEGQPRRALLQTHRMPGASVASAFCMAIRDASPAAFEHCLRNTISAEVQAHATGQPQTPACRFGVMSCYNCAPLHANAKALGYIRLWGLRRDSDAAPPFDAIAAALRHEDPRIELEPIREAYEGMPAAADADLRDFLHCATATVTRLVEEERRLAALMAAPDGAAITLTTTTWATRLTRTFTQFKNSSIPVLIEGESGSGKEVIGRTIHAASRRRDKPFIAVSCAVLSPQLVEAELLGYVKGAFTGADRDFKGFFERAHGGTLFLDEIAEFPLDVQSKLLRAIETGEFRPLGAERHVKVDVRIVIATTRNLKELTERGMFLKALYYRIHGIHIQAPPLREIADDIPAYAGVFLDEYNREHRTDKAWTQEAMKRLRQYDWPGNLRQLKNAVIHAASVAGRRIGPAQLPRELRDAKKAGAAGQPGKTPPLSALRANFIAREKKWLENALRAAAFNLSRAAAMLGISRFTLYKKMRGLGIPMPERLAIRRRS